MTHPILVTGAAGRVGDVKRYEQILAEDFMASLPDFLLLHKK